MGRLTVRVSRSPVVKRRASRLHARVIRMKAPFSLRLIVRPTGDWLGGRGGAILGVISRRERTGVRSVRANRRSLWDVQENKPVGLFGSLVAQSDLGHAWSVNPYR
jgi:hypothetical protein